MATATPLIRADPSYGVKVDAGVVAKPFRDEIGAKVAALKERGIEAPLLVGLLANDDPAAAKYAEWTGKACRADGLRYELRRIENPLDVERALNAANDDPKVHGIITYYPIFGAEEGLSGASQDDYLRDSISHRALASGHLTPAMSLPMASLRSTATCRCDVEGLCQTYRTNLYKNVRFLDYPRNSKKGLLPCTPLAVVKILE
eukprot:gene7069-6705_t